MVTIDRRTFVALLGTGIAGSVGVLTGCSADTESSPSASDDKADSAGANGSAGAAVTSDSPDAAAVGATLAGLSFAARRDPGCGCCLSWVDYLRSNGATVDVTEDPDRANYRQSVGIPDKAASCHTAIVDDYAIEGHVPAEAIVKLLATRPDAAGLALPGMPGDSPGMGGDDTSWANQKVVLVNRDGSLDAFAY